jgi:hypothetical protein
MPVSKPQSATNPFYVLLIIAGVLFVITACAYFTMAVREAGGAVREAGGAVREAGGGSGPDHSFGALVSRYGLTALIAELILLAIATFGAIGTDEYWSRRTANQAALINQTVGNQAIGQDTDIPRSEQDTPPHIPIS